MVAVAIAIYLWRIGYLVVINDGNSLVLRFIMDGEGFILYFGQKVWREKYFMVRVFNDLKTFGDVVLFIGLLVICFSLVIYSFTLLWMSFFTTLFGFFSSPIAGAISSLPHVLMVVISIIIFVLFLLNPLLLLHPIILPLKLLILNIPHQFEHRVIIFLLSWLRLDAGLNNLLRLI